MELESLGILLLIVVAIHALSVDFVAAEHIAHDDALVVVFEAPLVEREFLIDHIRGRNQSITDVGVDGVGRHEDLEGLEQRPFAVVFGVNLDLNRLSLGLFSDYFPLVDVGTSLQVVATANDFFVLETIAGHHLREIGLFRR